MEFSIQLVNQVLESKLFKGMNFDLIELILEIGKVEHFKKGEILMREGDQGDTFYWVKSGKLEVQIKQVDDQSALILNTLSAGELIGEMTLLGRNRRATTVVVLNDAELLCWKHADCYKLFYARPEIGFKVMLNMAALVTDRLQEMNLQVRNICS